MNQSESYVFYAPGWNNSYRVAQRGQGIYIYDTEGKRYLDGIGGTHVVTIGHGVPEIAEAMAEQARQVCFTNKTQFTSPAQESLAEKVVQMAPEGMAKVIFATGGSIANEIAIQLAQYYHLERGRPSKHKIIGRWHSYHGCTMTTLAASGSLEVRRGRPNYQLDLNFPHIQAPHCYQCAFHRSYPSCELACANELARVIEQEGPDNIAAFIAEPIVGGAGSAIVPKPGYYEKIREICDFYEVLLIAEEVVTGFGRTGKNFGIEHWKAIPDLITTAKGLSSGYAPIGAVIIHQKIAETFFKGSRLSLPTFVTYSGHPISCAAALVVQNYIAKHHLIEQCAVRGKYLKQQLQQLAERESLIGDVRGEGLLIGIELVQNQSTHQPFPRALKLAERLVQMALTQGLILRGRAGTGTGPEGDHILISPPFIITEPECDELVAILESSIQELKRSL